MKAPRLPIVLILGPDESAKHQLASEWIKGFSQNAQHWQYLSNSDKHFDLNVSSQAMVRLQACFCCSGRVALASTVVQLLREQRRHPKALDGILMTVSPAADVALVLEHFLQPLLVQLVTVVKVVRCALDQLQDCPNTDVTLNPQALKFGEDLAFLATNSIVDQPTWMPAHFQGAHLWPPEVIFDRACAITLFDSLAGMLWKFEAVLRTDREWYGFNFDGGCLETQVSPLRRGSYLKIISRPSHGSEASDAWLMSRLDKLARPSF
jgi:hypothetical protein